MGSDLADSSLKVRSASRTGLCRLRTGAILGFSLAGALMRTGGALSLFSLENVLRLRGRTAHGTLAVLATLARLVMLELCAPLAREVPAASGWCVGGGALSGLRATVSSARPRTGGRRAVVSRRLS